MTQNQIKIQYLISRYRYRHKDNAEALNALTKILWYSYPVVYLDREQSQREAQRLINARRASKHRVNRYIVNMAQCYDQLHFVTLTFTDEVLSKTSAVTRHRYVTRWLKANTRDYIGNVDYGKQNGREHYHAVVSFKRTPEGFEWPYGFQNVKKVGSISPENRQKQQLSGYLLKLSNHAGKPNAGRIFHATGFKEVDELPF